MTDLAATVDVVMQEWQLRPDGPLMRGHSSMVMPVHTEEGAAAMLKVSIPEPESEHEHIALRRWDGDGAVRLLRADPHRRALLLERQGPRNRP